MTAERRDDDVARARQGVQSASVSYGPRTPARTLADRWQDFSHRYGWRAYALPILIAITIAALLSGIDVSGDVPGASGHPNAAGNGNGNNNISTPPPVASSSMTLKNDAPQGDVNNSVLAAAALPEGPPYAMDGEGTFRVLPGSSPAVGDGGQLFRYSIDVEDGITGVDLDAFEQLVVHTLSDARSWAGHAVELRRVDGGQIDFHITLASAMTVRQLCGYTVHVETSCYAGAGAADVNRVVLNDARFVRGATAYVGDLNAYRTYMINHEVGHAIGHQHAHQCLPGGLAPVMMQQTFGLRSAATGELCEANPWPFPPHAKGAPGAEQPDTPQNDEYGLGDSD
jgi:hypothetical protein